MLLSSCVGRFAALPGDSSGEDELISESIVYEDPVVLVVAILGAPVLNPTLGVSLYPENLSVES
jgi:hypothetical protein